AIELTKFVHERHPGTKQPRNYQSDIVVHSGGDATPMLIRMNEPLRREGYVAYQSSYGPEPAAPGERRYSVLAVSRNPADQWPLYSLLVMTAGMLLHFVAKLFRWIRRETNARQAGVSA
ncbi:MAG: cytochrome c biogenesis protein ResB, partial [Planctomycetota bacterium]